ncbi:Peptidyl-prolyl cis-trans isomerase pin4 [Toensbergia leucococca]|nr:Peptidyl-prolyl cis-trans isomerase pin4 [Toensbergia leucococca]
MAGPKKTPAKSGKTPSKPNPKTKDTKPSDPADDNPTPAKLKPATAINTRHILCEKHSRKEAALAQLRSGAKFDDVAREFSEDKARQGGALGWKVRGSLEKGFEECAYGLGVSGVGRPVWGECRTGNGYHLVMVEGRR